MSRPMKPCHFYRIFDEMQKPLVMNYSSIEECTEMDALDMYIQDHSDVMEKTYMDGVPNITFKDISAYNLDVYVCDMRNNMSSVVESSKVLSQKKYKLTEYLKKSHYKYGMSISPRSTQPQQTSLTEEVVTEGQSVKLNRNTFKIMTLSQLSNSADKLMKSDNRDIVRFGQALKSATDDDFGHLEKYFADISMILFIGGDTLKECMPYIVSSVLYMKDNTPEVYFDKEIKNHRRVIKNRLKPNDDVLRLYYDFLYGVINNTLRIVNESVELSDELLPLLEARQKRYSENFGKRGPRDYTEDLDEEDEDEEETDNDEDNEDNTEEDTTDETDDDTDDTEDTDTDEDTEDEEDGPTDYTKDVEDDEDDTEEDNTNDTEDEEEDSQEEDELQTEGDMDDEPDEVDNEEDNDDSEEDDDRYTENFGKDGPTDYTDEVDTDDTEDTGGTNDDDTSDSDNADNGNTGTTDTVANDTTTDDTQTDVDTENDDSGDNTTSDDENNVTDETQDTQQDDNGLGDEPTDYTQDVGSDSDNTDLSNSDTGEDGEEGDDTTEDDTSEDESSNPSDDSSEGEDRETSVKNYNIRLKLVKLAESIEDILINLSKITYRSSIQNSVLERGIDNITKIKEQIISYMEYNLTADYKQNLYYYTIFMQALQLNLDMLTKNSEMSNNEQKDNK